MRGIDSIVLVPRAVGDASGELLSMGLEQGATRVVLVSALTVQYPAGEQRFAAEFKAAEDAVMASGLQWTILRCADFDSNAVAWAPQVQAGGIVSGAYGDASTSPIHPRDVAAVGVRALLDVGHDGHTYVLTGPQQVSQRDKARLIGEAIGKEVSWVELSPEQVRQGLSAQRVPKEIQDRMLGSLASYAREPAPSTDTVHDVLSRPALTFAQWVEEHATLFEN